MIGGSAMPSLKYNTLVFTSQGVAYISSLPVGVRQPNQPIMTYSGITKLVPIAEAYMFDGLTTQGTMHVKVESDAPFKRVRIRAYNRTGAVDNRVKASIAVSEVLANDTNSNRYNPIINGLVDNNTWQLAKWSGANETLLDAATAAEPSIAVSDWININSVASTDSNKYIALIKYMIDPSNGTVVPSSTYNTWRGASA